MWGENAVAWEVFVACASQWRLAGMAAVGLDYAAVAAVMGLLGLPDADRRACFHRVRVMEAAALEVWSREREQAP